MFNLLHPKDNFKTIANCIDQMTNYDFEEFHLLQANVSILYLLKLIIFPKTLAIF